MKVLLLDVYIKDAKYRICKDTNGSYGTANDYGDSLFPKLLSKIAKNTNVGQQNAKMSRGRKSLKSYAGHTKIGKNNLSDII